MYINRQQRFTIILTLLPVVVIWLVNGIYLAMLAQISMSLFWLADFFQWVILPVSLLILLAKKALLFPKHYGFDTSALDWKYFILGTLAVFITTGLAFFLTRNLLWQLLNHPTGFFTFPGVFPSGLLGKVIWVYSAITAGIVESIFFIGLPWLLYCNIRNAPSQTAFIALASFVFAIAHWEQGPHIVVAAFSSNLVASLWFFRFGTLWPVAAGHALIDFVAFA
jgi:hypothetical protein